MKTFFKFFLPALIISAIVLACFDCHAQSFTDVTGNKRYTGLQNFTQGTIVSTANFSVSGAGDTLRIQSTGDSCNLYATNKITIASPTYHNATLFVKGATTLQGFTAATGTVTSGTVTTLGSTTATITNVIPTTIKPAGADSATIYALSPSAGWTKYCSDCTAADGSVGCLVTYNGALWKRHW